MCRRSIIARMIPNADYSTLHSGALHSGALLRQPAQVVHGRTREGARYLNFYVKHLGRAGFAVGGLLGEDDHTDAETPTQACSQHLSLLAQGADLDNHGSELSVAEASFD
ncbi:unnamed protein product [Prorocentrum cordatum]|uniref:Uncharacterized protein n=1 Tax=Prorocentrum cordatum TaxID=2364126 RepID=A0ABN9XCU8_9DINO|nr:unnamed protein product [Polarella glacialis]